ncbi:Mediator of RNA polymerase II transcription subunit 28 [Rhynchospora pubera]|uniref:Mediator of RNA polymerase II transcription subunit 28 n=1 Tax=Rhynchospora pubera TaxID=906938 RepID=A0AAV8HYD1_9POAL|nr:Mediator of RNA polymerase II transcription subunit 28 [Rhynchospora pubera]
MGCFLQKGKQQKNFSSLLALSTQKKMDDQHTQSAATPAQTPPPPASAHTSPPQPQLSAEERKKEELLGHVAALEAALLPCLPARELQAVDRSHSSHQIDVERHARDFMEAAKKLQLYFMAIQREEEPTKEQLLQQEMAIMEEELKTKDALIQKNSQLIQKWRGELKEQLDRHSTELERV